MDTGKGKIDFDSDFVGDFPCLPDREGGIVFWVLLSLWLRLITV